MTPFGDELVRAQRRAADGRVQLSARDLVLPESENDDALAGYLSSLQNILALAGLTFIQALFADRRGRLARHSLFVLLCLGCMTTVLSPPLCSVFPSTGLPGERINCLCTLQLLLSPPDTLATNPGYRFGLLANVPPGLDPSHDYAVDRAILRTTWITSLLSVLRRAQVSYDNTGSRPLHDLFFIPDSWYKAVIVGVDRKSNKGPHCCRIQLPEDPDNWLVEYVSRNGQRRPALLQFTCSGCESSGLPSFVPNVLLMSLVRGRGFSCWQSNVFYRVKFSTIRAYLDSNYIWPGLPADVLESPAFDSFFRHLRHPYLHTTTNRFQGQTLPRYLVVDDDEKIKAGLKHRCLYLVCTECAGDVVVPPVRQAVELARAGHRIKGCECDLADGKAPKHSARVHSAITYNRIRARREAAIAAHATGQDYIPEDGRSHKWFRSFWFISLAAPTGTLPRATLPSTHQGWIAMLPARDESGGNLDGPRHTVFSVPTSCECAEGEFTIVRAQNGNNPSCSCVRNHKLTENAIGSVLETDLAVLNGADADAGDTALMNVFRRLFPGYMLVWRSQLGLSLSLPLAPSAPRWNTWYFYDFVLVADPGKGGDVVPLVVVEVDGAQHVEYESYLSFRRRDRRRPRQSAPQRSAAIVEAEDRAAFAAALQRDRVKESALDCDVIRVPQWNYWSSQQDNINTWIRLAVRDSLASILETHLLPQPTRHIGQIRVYHTSQGHVDVLSTAHAAAAAAAAAAEEEEEEEDAAQQ